MDPSQLTVLQFANDCTMTLKQLKIRSFNIFNKCKLACVKDLKNQQTEQCFKACENDLDEFYKFKRSNKVENSSYVFYHFPIENTLGLNSPSMTLNAEQARDYHHKCLETEVKLKDYIKKLQIYLDNLEGKYIKK